MKMIHLYDNYYALEFMYHMVTEMTVAMALPYSFKEQLKPVKFAAETSADAGTKRMNSDLMKTSFPRAVAIAKEKQLDLQEYVLLLVGS